MKTITVSRFMTRTPETIGADQPLSAAHRIMRAHGIRHLPVLEVGRLVGVVSQHDLHFMETLKDVDPDEVAVAEAVSPNTFTVTRRTSLHRAAAAMAEHRIGAAVVVDAQGAVVGVFTATDALRALAALTAPGRAA